MLNCLRTELKTLFKWKATKCTIVFLALLSVLISSMNVLNEEPALSGIFVFPAIVLLIVSAIGGLFVYQDYSQNTIRNKIVVGHSRLAVYLAKIITIFALHLILVIGFLFIFCTIGCLCLDTEYVVWEGFWKNCVIVLSSTFVVASLTSMISINMKSPLGGLLPMIFVTSLLYGGIFGMELLSVNDAEQAIKIVTSIPVICLMNLSETVVPNNMWAILITATVVTVTFVTLGYLLFRKADLK